MNSNILLDIGCMLSFLRALHVNVSWKGTQVIWTPFRWVSAETRGHISWWGFKLTRDYFKSFFSFFFHFAISETQQQPLRRSGIIDIPMTQSIPTKYMNLKIDFSIYSVDNRSKCNNSNPGWSLTTLRRSLLISSVGLRYVHQY